MMKRTLKTVPIIVMRTCTTLSMNSHINREYNRRISQFSYTDIFVTITVKFLSVVTPLSTYCGCSTQKMFWEEKFLLVNMRSCGRHNVRKQS